MYLLAIAAAAAALSPGMPQAPDAGAPALKPHLRAVGSLLLGHWRTKQVPNMGVIDFVFTPGFGGAAIMGHADGFKGSKNSFEIDCITAYDPKAKVVYYYEFVDDGTVLKGTMTTLSSHRITSRLAEVQNGQMAIRSESTFPDHDTMKTVAYGRRNGKWVMLHNITFHRVTD